MADLDTTARLARTLLREHGLIGWTFRWDAARKRGGCCHFKTQHISMSRYLVPLWTEAEVRNVLLHEIAHALAGYAAGHGPAWRATARAIGCTGERTHSNETVQGRWHAVCPVHGIGKRRYHRRRKLLCGRCYQSGVRNPLSYIEAEQVLADADRVG